MKKLILLSILILLTLNAKEIESKGDIKITDIPAVVLTNGSEFELNASGIDGNTRISIVPDIVANKKSITNFKLPNGDYANTVYVNDGYIFVGGDNGLYFYILNENSNTIEYKDELNDIGSIKSIAYNNKLYFLATKDKILRVNRNGNSISKEDEEIESIDIIQSIKIDGVLDDRIYVATNNGVKIFDISSNKFEEKGTILSGKEIQDIEVNKYNLYVIDRDTIYLYDTSNLTNIKEINKKEFDGVYSFALYNSKVFVGIDSIKNDKLQYSTIILDENLTKIGNFSNFIGQQVDDIIIDDNISYVLVDDTILALNTENIENPKLKTSLKVKNAQNLFLYKNKLYVSSWQEGVNIVNGAIDYSTLLKGSIYKNSLFYDFKYRDNYLFIAQHFGVSIYDVSNLADINFIKDINTSEAKSIELLNDYLFIADYDEDLKIYNISNINEPIEIETKIENRETLNSLAISKEYNYLLGAYENSLKLYDISNINSIKLLKTFDIEGSLHISIDKNLALIASGRELLKIDLDTLEADEIMNFSGNIEDVNIDNNTVFITTTSYNTTTVKIVDIDRDDNSLYDTGNTIDLNDLSYNMISNEDILLVANGDSGISIIDKEKTLTIDSINLPSDIRKIELSEDKKTLFALSFYGGIYILDNYIKLQDYEINGNSIKVKFPEYTTFGYYSVKIYNDIDFSKAYGVLTLVSKEDFDSVEKNNLEFSIVTNENEKGYYEIGEEVFLNAFLKNNKNEGINLFEELSNSEYFISFSDRDIVEFVRDINYSNSKGILRFLAYGRVTVTIQAKGVIASKQFQVGDPEKLKLNDKDFIIIVGTIEDENISDDLRYTFDKIGNSIYQLAHLQGVSHNNIHYFNPNGSQNLKYTWNKNNYDIVDNSDFDLRDIESVLDNMPTSIKPLVIYIIDHGDKDKTFFIGSSKQVSANELNEILNNFQNRTGRDLILIIETCYSGSIMQELQSEEYNRLIITSTNDSYSYMAPSKAQPFFSENTSSFSTFLREELLKDKSFKEAFEDANETLFNSYLNKANTQVPQIFVSKNFFNILNSNLGSIDIYSFAPKILDYRGKNEANIISLNRGEELKLFLKSDVKYKDFSTTFAVIRKLDELIDVNGSDYKSSTEITLNLESNNTIKFDEEGFFTIDYSIKNDDGMDFIKRGVLVGVGKSENELKEKYTKVFGNMVLNIKKGWNLKAFPADTNLTNLNVFSEIWKYNSGKWEKNPTMITKGEGFWINSKVDDIVIFSGDNYKFDLSNITDSWKLVGTGKTISDINTTNKIIWSFRENEWKENPKILENGDGFWIKSN